MLCDTTGITTPGFPSNIGASGLFVAVNGNLYSVDENGNYVVWKLLQNAISATFVAGSSESSGSSSSQLGGPNDVYVDRYRNLYVTDTVNSRVQKFSNGSTNGQTIAGVSGSS